MRSLNKKNILLFLGIFIFSMFTYIFFITGFQSIDTYKIVTLGLDEYAKTYSLSDGRIFMGILNLIADSVNIKLEVYYIIVTIIAIAISSISVIKIYNIVKKIDKTEGKIAKNILMIISYLYIFHFMFIDNMQFIENIVMALSILLYIISAEKIILQRKYKIGTILCVLATIAYQGTINVFITTAFLFVLIDNTQDIKTKTKQIIKGLAIVVISAIIDIILVLIMSQIINSNQTMSRVNINIIENILINLKYMNLLVIKSLYLFFPYIQIVYIFAYIILIYVESIKNRKATLIYCIFLITIISYASCLLMITFFPNSISKLNGRIFGSVGSICSSIALIIFCNRKELRKITKKIFYILTISYFILSTLNTFCITSKLKSSNNIDREFGKEIVKEVKKYEYETNKKVEKFAINYIMLDRENDKITQSRSFKKLGLYGRIILEFYTGRYLERIDFDENIKNEYFKNDEEAMKIVDNVIYIQTK